MGSKVTTVAYRHGCPICSGYITSDELTIGKCGSCSHSLEVESMGEQLLRILIKEVEDFKNFFTMVTKFRPLPLQTYWIKRLFFGDSFALIAPTGVGKSTLLAVYALYRAYFYGNKVYIVTPTREIAKQFYVKMCEYLKNMNGYDANRIKIVFYDSTARNVSEIKDIVKNGLFNILITSAAFLTKHHDIIIDKKIDIIIADDLDSILRNSKNVDRILKLLGFSDIIIEKSMKLVKIRQNLIIAKASKKPEVVDELRRYLIDLEAELRNEISKRAIQLIVASATGRAKGLKPLVLKELLGFDAGAVFEYWRNIDDFYTYIDSEIYTKILRIVKNIGSGIIFYSNLYKECINELQIRLERAGIRSAIVKSGNKAVDRFRRGEVDVLIGPSSYYGILVRGLDEPLRIKFTLFIGVPQITRDLYDSLNNIRFMYIVLRKLEELGVDLATQRKQLIDIIQRSNPALFALYSKLLKNSINIPQDLINNVNILQLIKNRVYNEIKKVLDEKGKIVIENYCIIVKHGDRLIVVKPDPYTYIQASGRSSRLYNGCKTFGLSIVFEKHKELIDILESRLKRLVNFDGFKYLNIEGIQGYIDKIIDTRNKASGNDVRSGISTALIVVESPTKAKIIASMFGRPAKRIFNDVIVYETIIPIDIDRVYVAMITATLGHIVDLVVDEGLYGVKIDHGKYIPIYDFITRCRNCGYQNVGIYDSCPYCNSLNIFVSSSIYNVLKKLALEVDKIFVASDPDTEGEKIAFDIKMLLLPFNRNIYRIEFREVTKKAFLEAIRNPKNINVKRVEAQITRRVADRWIGFEVSLWLQNHFNKPWLGAGRVQTPILIWSVDRYKEYKDKLGYVLKFDLNGYKGRLYLGNNIDKEYIEKLMTIINERGFEIDNVKVYEKIVSPPPPYTTDALLSDASIFFGFTASKAMAIAQSLFELGLITYHRTDSTRVSSTGIAIAKETLSKMGMQQLFIPRSWDMDLKGENAHEAIRPTNPFTSNELIEKAIKGEMGIITNLSGDHVRLYDLIFRRFIASQMSYAKVLYLKGIIRVDRYVIDIEAPIEIVEEGFTKVYRIQMFPQLKELLNARFIKPSSISIVRGSSKGLYRVADLVRMLKENGIGRPSTYAKAIDNNIRHGYMILSKKKIAIPTKLGIEVADIVRKYFDGVVGVNATRDLEKLIDYVEEGQIDIYNAFSRIKDVIDAIQSIFDIQSSASSNINVDLAIA